MIGPRKYCPHCGDVAQSRIYEIVGGTIVHCGICHRFIEVIYNDDYVGEEDDF
uniref:Uncharacterized protein n=1 Tax=viral metagenome TaxID=1070528 RepID=A0A6M3LTA2_9ZZZZ